MLTMQLDGNIPVIAEVSAKFFMKISDSGAGGVDVRKAKLKKVQFKIEFKIWKSKIWNPK